MLSSRNRVLVVVAVWVLLAAACAGSAEAPTSSDTQDVAATTAPVPTTVPATVGETPTSPPVEPDPTPEPESVSESGPDAAPEPTTAVTSGDSAEQSEEPTAVPVDVEPAELLRPDLLTFANGVLVADATGLPSGSSATTLRMIDGDPLNLAVSNDGRPEVVEVTFKLPASTTFDRFAIPNIQERGGNSTFYQSVVISGSSEAVDSGYVVLASFSLETHDNDDDVTELVPEVAMPVRWVKVVFEGGINIEEGDEGRTNLEFSELIGNGSQEPRELSTAFTGIWQFRLTERQDIRGEALELRQTGTLVTGCLGTIELAGTVNGAIARINGVDRERNDRPSAFIFVADEDGTLQSIWSENNTLFNSHSPIVVPETTSSPCSEQDLAPVACGSLVYVNFDLDSAAIRSDSEQVIDDLYALLAVEAAAPVSIVGHTSTEGTDDYNLDLSQRRSQAVVDALIQRGFDPGSVSAIGLGETAPLRSPDNDESSRALNRRVEITCG